MPPRRRKVAPNTATDNHKFLSGNALVCGDNIDILRQLPDECVDLIYLDPPFNSNQFYVAAFGDKGTVAQQLRDVWRWTVETENAFQRLPHGSLLDCLRGIRLQAGENSKMAAYCVYMGRRLAEMRRIMKPDGSIYLHCDPHANAYLRILMDAVFGGQNFRREIVWQMSAASGFKGLAKNFVRGHDTILYYGKGKSPKFNKPWLPYDAKQLARFSGTDENGRKYKSITRTRRLYLDEAKGVPVTDVWGDIANFQTVVNSPEIIGYPTQKPRALLDRIIKASSNPGDLVLDPFCGCGTAADVAAALGRGYLGIDISAIAVRVMQQRLESRGEAAAPAVYGLELNDFNWNDFERRALMSRDESEDGTPGWAWAEDKVAGLLNAIPNQRKTGDGGVDARYFGATDIERNEGVIIPIQVKMHRNRTSVGRPDLDRLLGTQTAMQNRGLHAPMSLLISLYPPPDSLRVFAAAQGRVTITTREAGAVEYPVMQAISVQEMLQREERPALPPVDPRSLVGDTQDRMLIG